MKLTVFKGPAENRRGRVVNQLLGGVYRNFMKQNYFIVVIKRGVLNQNHVWLWCVTINYG